MKILENVVGSWESSRRCRCFLASCRERDNIDALLSDLRTTPWHVVDMYDNVNDKWHYWKTLFLDILNKHAPLVKLGDERGRMMTGLMQNSDN